MGSHARVIYNNRQMRIRYCNEGGGCIVIEWLVFDNERSNNSKQN